jgi:ribosomal protein S18 acetylase RimI-like enzyme
LRFERVASVQHIEDYARLNARAYGLSEEDAIAAFRGSRLWRQEVFAYVAYEGLDPVACAGACQVDGRLFLVLVATEAAHRRRGFGEAVTRKALTEASRATGIKRVCLQATADGKPVYEKIGLRVNSSLQLFMLSPS